MSFGSDRNRTGYQPKPDAGTHGFTAQDDCSRRDLLELGRLLDCLAIQAQRCALSSQANWEFLANALLSGLGTADAARQLTKAIGNRVNRGSILDSEHLWRYCVSNVFRSVEVGTSDLSKRWHVVCRSLDLTEPRAYVTAQVFQEPLLVTRQGGGIKVFLNVCPHRQTQLLTGHGRLRRAGIRCQYHSWAFSCNGDCISIPRASGLAFGSERAISQYCLQQLPSVETNGYVYAWLGGAVSPSDAILPETEGLHDKPPAATSIAELLSSMHPSYPNVKQPEIPSDMCFLIRLGWLRAAFERDAAAISSRRGAALWSLLEDAESLRPEECNTLELHLLELRQSFLDGVDLPEDWREFRNTVSLLRPSATSRYVKLTPEPACREVTPVEALPVWTYRDSELFLLEVEHLIKPTWQFIGHEKEISQPGDLTHLDIAGERVYVGRRTDGTLFAGRMLRFLREQPEASWLERSLEPLDLDVWNGIIFIRFSHEGPRVADVWEHPQLLEASRLPEMVPLGELGSYDFDVEANYKILWENFLELYHFQTAHKGMCRMFHVPPESDLLPMRQSPSPNCNPKELSYVRNLRVCASHSEKDEADLRRVAETSKYLPKPLHFTIFGSISKQDQAPITLGLTIFPDHIQAMSFIPLGPRYCRVRIRSYGHELDLGTDSGRAMAAAREVNVGSLQVELVEEDIFLNYLTATGIASKLCNRRGLLSRMEVSVQQFQRKLRQTIPGSDCDPRPAPGTLKAHATVAESVRRKLGTVGMFGSEEQALDVRKIPAFLMSQKIETPAFVFDKDCLHEQTSKIARLAREAGCHFLYAMKALSFGDVVRTIAEGVEGLSASSVFEAVLARKILGAQGMIHATSPGLRAEEVQELSQLCDMLVFNSLSQWQRLRHLASDCSLGLRVNPQLSIVRDPRHDPCRESSKLGVRADQLAAALSESTHMFERLQGLHVHNACDINDFGYLFKTLSHLECRLSIGLRRLRWINLGGGYLFDNPARLHCFFESIYQLKSNYGLEVYIEPGAAVVRRAGFLVASVIDLFNSDGTKVAVLDTTVSHVPEVFEYQFSPCIAGASASGQYTYLLAGSTCLAGDLFGTYSFDSELDIGSKVVFPDMGAYTLVKAHMFNGMRLPTIYTFSNLGGLELRRRCTYQDFLVANGETANAAL